MASLKAEATAGAFCQRLLELEGLCWRRPTEHLAHAGLHVWNVRWCVHADLMAKAFQLDLPHTASQCEQMQLFEVCQVGLNLVLVQS